MPAERLDGLRIADLSPANFAIVMATGIVGVDAHQQGYPALGGTLLAIGCAAWALLVALNIARGLRHPRALQADLCNHLRAPGFLSWPAATAVLGSLWLVLGLDRHVSEWLAGLAAVLWLACTYGVVMALTLQREKPAIAEGLNGSWLLLVVSTQSIAVLGALLATGLDPGVQSLLHFGAVAMWLCGGMLYVWVIAIIVYRWMFVRLHPQELSPTYWINMGAMAISALAGALLLRNVPRDPFLAGLAPVLAGATLMFWAVASWWIPLLAALIAWRHARARWPIRYEVGYWAAVFPLGMYSAATREMAAALDLRFLGPLTGAFFWLAVAAWLLTAWGLLGQCVRAWKLPEADRRSGQA